MSEESPVGKEFTAYIFDFEGEVFGTTADFRHSLVFETGAVLAGKRRIVVKEKAWPEAEYTFLAETIDNNPSLTVSQLFR